MDFSKQKRNYLWKVRNPEDTVAKVRQILATAGITLNQSMTYTVCDSLHWCGLKSSLLGLNANGKGVTKEAALASGHAEFIERLSFPPQWIKYFQFDYNNELTRSLLNYEWLEGYRFGLESGENCLSIKKLVDSQVRFHREELLAGFAQTDWDKHWVDGYSLLSGESIRIPIKVVDWLSSSNGLAAGNTPEEAVLQASHELFERHSAFTIVHSESVVPHIDISSLCSDRINRIAAVLRARNQELFFKDFSLDELLPVSGLMIVNHELPEDHMEHQLLFFGSSFFPEERVLRCLTESMQGRFLDNSNFGIPPRQLFNKKREEELFDYTNLFGYGVPGKDLSFLKAGETVQPDKPGFTSLEQEYEAMADICRKLDTDWIYVDLTNPLFKFPVVRVIFPGLMNRCSCFFREEPFQQRRRIMESYFQRKDG